MILHRRSFTFALRTLFVAITAFAILLGYYVSWRYQRQVARQWLKAHEPPGPLAFDYVGPPLPERPWMLRLIEDVETQDDVFWVAPLESEQGDLPAYYKELDAMAKLFPECHIEEVGPFKRTRPLRWSKTSLQ